MQSKPLRSIDGIAPRRVASRFASQKAKMKPLAKPVAKPDIIVAPAAKASTAAKPKPAIQSPVRPAAAARPARPSTAATKRHPGSPGANPVRTVTPRSTEPVRLGRPATQRPVSTEPVMPRSRPAAMKLTPRRPLRAGTAKPAAPPAPRVARAPKASLDPTEQLLNELDFIMTEPAVPETPVHIPAARQLTPPLPQAEPETVAKIYNPPPRPAAKKGKVSAVSRAQAAEQAEEKSSQKADGTRSLYKRLLDWAQYPALAAIAFGAAYSVELGQWFVLVYAIVAILRGAASRTTFAVAIFLIVAIVVFQVLDMATVAENTAVYAYLLLVFGTLQAMFELFRTGRSKRVRI